MEISAEELLDSFEKPGKFIGSIFTDAECYLEEPEQEDRCINDCFDEANERYFFGLIDNIEDNIIYIISDKHYRYLKYSDKESKNQQSTTDILKHIRHDAKYGDIMKGNTLVDKKIRKGFDVHIDDDKISVNDYLIDKLQRLWCNKFMYKLSDIEIKPYKINIYEKGDFFESHRDSPTNGTIGTIILNIIGDPECFIINDNIPWKNVYNVCMFYTDVLHKVEPVTCYRETLTFQVFSKTNDNTINSLNTKRFLQMVDTKNDFCVLLSNGYTYINSKKEINSPDTFKGVDRALISTLNELKLSYNVVPVIVVNRNYFDDFAKYDKQHTYEWNILEKYKYAHDGEEKWYHYDIMEKDIEKKDIEEHISKTDDDSCMWEHVSNGYPINLSVFNLPPQIMDKINCPVKEIPMMKNIYHMGNGFMIGERYRTNIYIGNQHTGQAIENVYFNMAVVVKLSR
jgi:hypothetical protein